MQDGDARGGLEGDGEGLFVAVYLEKEALERETGRKAGIAEGVRQEKQAGGAEPKKGSGRRTSERRRRE